MHFLLDPVTMVAGRLGGIAMTWVGFARIATIDSVDPSLVWKESIQWGAVGVLGALLLMIFGFYLPSRDRAVRASEDTHMKALADAQERFAKALEGSNDRSDRRHEGLLETLNMMATNEAHRIEQCSQVHEIVRARMADLASSLPVPPKPKPKQERSAA